MESLIFLDVETTGTDPSRHAIIEIACLKWHNGKILHRFESLIYPHGPLPNEIILLTGIHDEMLQNAPVFSEVKEKILEFIGMAPIVGHNIAFDIAFLKSHHLDLKNSQIDTVSLAHILLRKENSYALEVLMKKYGLPLRNSHRAMADTETTVDFFEFLLREIEKIPNESRDELQQILEKSPWEGKIVFEGHESIGKNGKRSKKNMQKQKENTDNGKIISKNYWSEKITEKFLKGEKFLLASEREIPWKMVKNYPLIIAYASVRKQYEMLREAQHYGLHVKFLKESYFFISPKKWRKMFQEKKLLSPEETPFFLKIALWMKETETGDREEIVLEREEYGLFENLADREGKDIFWAKALKEAQRSNIIFIHQAWLARGIEKKIIQKGKNKKRGLLIVEASRLEDTFTQALKEKYTEANLHTFLGDRVTLIFGFLGIFYERYTPEEFGGMRGNVILNETTQSSLEWRRFFEALKNLPPHPKKEEILDTLTPREGTIQWINNIANELTIHSAPIFLGEIFQQRISPFSQIILQSGALDIDKTVRFIQEILELDSTWQVIQEKMMSVMPGCRITIPDNFPEPRTEGYFKRCLKLFTEIVEKQNGKSLFILASKKTLEAMYRALLPKVKQIFNEATLLAVGHSGGLGKSIALFLENPENSVLMATHQILPRLQEIEDHLEIIVFQKIPFDPPDDPLLKARAREFENGFENYTLPRAVMKFRETFLELGKSKTLKHCYLLDSRLLTRDYGKMFL